jgi:cytidine deaminase
MGRKATAVRAAYKVARRADPACTYKIGAVVMDGSLLVGVGANSVKTHTKNPKISRGTLKTQLCAEVSAVLNAMHTVTERDLQKCSIYVVRRRADGTMAMAKPCTFCREFLRRVGIKEAFYTDRNGNIQRLSL